VLEKIDELGAYVADEAPEHLDAISSMTASAEEDDYSAIRAAANKLAERELPAGSLSQAAAFELADICDF
jgi:hypothetical protein